jgi:hypothetical protein
MGLRDQSKVMLRKTEHHFILVAVHGPAGGRVAERAGRRIQGLTRMSTGLYCGKPVVSCAEVTENGWCACRCTQHRRKPPVELIHRSRLLSQTSSTRVHRESVHRAQPEQTNDLSNSPKIETMLPTGASLQFWDYFLFLLQYECSFFRTRDAQQLAHGIKIIVLDGRDKGILAKCPERKEVGFANLVGQVSKCRRQETRKIVP